MSFGDIKLHGHSNMVFLDVNQSKPEASLTTNHKFYRALGILRGPWCKQPLMTQVNWHLQNWQIAREFVYL